MAAAAAAAAAAPGGRGGSFTLVQDKSLLASACLAEWHPDKDLLALAAGDGTLAVYRPLSWQRLWSLHPESRVSAICWGPGGRTLAVGHEDGTITLHLVEDGTVLRTSTVHRGRVECLHWVEAAAPDQEHNEDLLDCRGRTKRLLPPPPPLPSMLGSNSSSVFEALRGAAEEGRQQDIDDPTPVSEHLNVLCSCDSDCNIVLSASGLVALGQISLRKLEAQGQKTQDPVGSLQQPSLEEATVSKVMLAPDLKALTAICKGPISPDGKPLQQLFSLAVDTAVLGTGAPSFHQVAMQIANIRDLLEVAQKSLEAMTKHWTDASRAFQDKMQVYQRVLNDHGSDLSPREELLSVLACGPASGSSQLFLTSSLGEPGLKRLAKTLDSAASQVHTLLVDYLQPAVENVLFRLGEVRGLARWKSQAALLGLTEDLVELALERAGIVIVQSERVLRSSSDLAVQHRMFFVWLLKLVRQINGETLPPPEPLPPTDTSAIAGFLESCFEADPVSPHVASTESAKVLMTREEEEIAEELVKMGGFKDTVFMARPLHKLLTELCASCNVLFGLPSMALSPTFRTLRMVQLAHAGSELATPHACAEVTANIPSDVETERHGPASISSTLLAFQANATTSTGPSGRASIGLLHSERHGSVSEDKGLLLRLTEGLEIIDLAIYKDGALALLLAEQGTLPSLLLLPCRDLPLQLMPPSLMDGVLFSSLAEALLQKASNPFFEIDTAALRRRLLSYQQAAAPLALSAQRGLACVFAGRKRVLVLDLEEDEGARDDDME
eukprot:SM000034S12754  [mRNA]  locus=s34:530460:536094:- [translate_table: standard]